MQWILLALGALIAYGLFNFFVKLSSDKINVPLAVGIVGTITALVGFITFAVMRVSGQPVTFTWSGFRFALYAGLASGVAELLYYFMFLRGAKLSIGLPLVIGGTVLTGSILGILVLSESLSIYQGIGITVTIIGIVLLSL